jgi:type VI protein secretion system component VasK
VTVIDWADVLSRVSVTGLLVFGLVLLLTERLIPRGRLEEKQKELDRERQLHDEDRAVIRALQHRGDDSVQ